jgi:AraC-like DNA-binding protein
MMTEMDRVEFFSGKLDELERVGGFRLHVARQKPVFSPSKVLNKWRLITILSGQRLYRVADGAQVRDLTLERGDLLLVEPYAGVRLEEDQTYDLLSIVDNPSVVRFVSKKRQKGGAIVHDPDAVLHSRKAGHDWFELLLKTLAQSVTRPLHPDPAPLLRYLWSECRLALRASNNALHSASEYLLENIIDYIQEHLGETLNCSRVGAEFGISANYVAQLFAREMSCGFSKYVGRQRLEMAKMLLANSRMNVAEIADYCGFSRANYFISQFKKQVQMTPLAYRIARDGD